MGYSHYLDGKIECSPMRWAKILEDIRAVVAEAKVPLADGNGDGGTSPEFSEKAICFNGVDAQGHETFHVENGMRGFHFCKTAQKPYDIIVCACLIILHEYIPTIKVSSDGNAVEWQSAVDLCQKVLGYGVYPCVKED
jgi:hypothetical protein